MNRPVFYSISTWEVLCNQKLVFKLLKSSKRSVSISCLKIEAFHFFDLRWTHHENICDDSKFIRNVGTLSAQRARAIPSIGHLQFVLFRILWTFFHCHHFVHDIWSWNLQRLFGIISGRFGEFFGNVHVYCIHLENIGHFPIDWWFWNDHQKT